MTVLLPVLLHRSLAYVVDEFVSNTMRHLLATRTAKQHKRARSKEFTLSVPSFTHANLTASSHFSTSLAVSLMRPLWSQLLLYPLEFVCTRLLVQGSSALADGIPRPPVYTGLVDCALSIYEDDGIWGFYRGFGAVVCQTAITLGIVRGAQRLILKD